MNLSAILLGAAFAAALYAVYYGFRVFAPPHAVAALDRARPADWIACGIVALIFVVLVSL